MNLEQAVATLTLSEVGIGTLIHTLHLPLGGHLLSLNQLFILTRLSLVEPRGSQYIEPHSLTLKCSLIGASLKSLSPAGKRLTPMLAIATQGLFFSAGVATHTLLKLPFQIALILGGLALGSWAVIQPLIVAHIVFGKSYFSGIQKVLNWLTDSLHTDSIHWWTLWIIFLGVKLLLSFLTVQLALKSPRFVKKYEAWIERLSVTPAAQALVTHADQSSNDSKPLHLALKTFFKPGFLGWLFLGILLSSALFWFGENPEARTEQEGLLLILRPITISGLGLWFGFWLKNRIKLHPKL